MLDSGAQEFANFLVPETCGAAGDVPVRTFVGAAASVGVFGHDDLALESHPVETALALRISFHF
jgi:hypothetical protein